MTTLSLPSGEWLMVDVPQFSMRHTLASDKILYRFDNGSWGKIILPPGDYTLYGADPLRLTEEEWKGVVEHCGSHGFNSYGGAEIFKSTATESGHSLIAANGYTVGETIILKINS
jgi:hypothetical protein